MSTKKTCTHIFTADLFIISETWKQPKCPSVGEGMNCKPLDKEMLSRIYML